MDSGRTFPNEGTCCRQGKLCLTSVAHVVHFGLFTCPCLCTVLQYTLPVFVSPRNIKSNKRTPLSGLVEVQSRFLL